MRISFFFFGGGGGGGGLRRGVTATCASLQRKNRLPTRRHPNTGDWQVIYYLYISMYIYIRLGSRRQGTALFGRKSYPPSREEGGLALRGTPTPTGNYKYDRGQLQSFSSCNGSSRWARRQPTRQSPSLHRHPRPARGHVLVPNECRVHQIMTSSLTPTCTGQEGDGQRESSRHRASLLPPVSRGEAC